MKVVYSGSQDEQDRLRIEIENLRRNILIDGNGELEARLEDGGVIALNPTTDSHIHRIQRTEDAPTIGFLNAHFTNNGYIQLVLNSSNGKYAQCYKIFPNRI